MVIAAETFATSDLSSIFRHETTAGTWTCEVVANDGVLDPPLWMQRMRLKWVYSLRFDGSNDYVEVAHDAALSIAGDYTIEFGFCVNRVILSKNNGYSTGYTLRFDYYSVTPINP